MGLRVAPSKENIRKPFPLPTPTARNPSFADHATELTVMPDKSLVINATEEPSKENIRKPFPLPTPTAINFPSGDHSTELTVMPDKSPSKRVSVSVTRLNSYTLNLFPGIVVPPIAI